MRIVKLNLICLSVFTLFSCSASEESTKRVGASLETIQQEAGEVQTLRLASDDGRFFLSLVRIPPGAFLKGSHEGFLPSADVQSMLPKVEEKSVGEFWMGKTEVTQAQWQYVMGNNPSYHLGDDLPVEQVSWHDAQEFCRRLSSLSDYSIQLPTSTEWEYACRASSSFLYSFGNDEETLGLYAWYDGNSKAKTNPVMTKQPNAWGLYDMHGNVWEWCADKHTDSPSTTQEPSVDSFYVYKGGAWNFNPIYLMAPLQGRYFPHYRSYALGFRIMAKKKNGAHLEE